MARYYLMAEGISIYEAVAGPFDPRDLHESYVTAYNTLIGTSGEREPVAIMGKLDKGMQGQDVQLEPHEYARVQVAQELAEVLTKRAATCNTLTDWMLYQQMLEDHGRPCEPDSTALMIGAVTALSARSFDVLAHEVYGADRALIVDLNNEPTVARHGTFLQADGLRLPLRNESMDIVHTSQLLHMLCQSDGKAAAKADTHTLFSEIGRVLKPGGQLLMREVLPDTEKIDRSLERWPLAELREKRITQRFGGMLLRQLAKNGMSLSAASPAFDPVNMDFAFDPNRNFAAYPREATTLTLAIYAQKDVA